MKLIEVTKKPIYVIADVHGDFDTFLRNVELHDLKDCIIIVAGDCGFGFYREPYYERVMGSLNRHFVERNINCFMIRGNHDDPYYFDNEKINHSNLKAISDYTVLSVGNENILCIGGAISIDRKMRINNYWSKVDHYAISMNVSLEEARSKFLPSYWVNEVPVYNEEALNELKDNGINIDYVVTHTSPSFAFKSDKNGVSYWINLDDALEKDLEEERSVLSKIFQKVTDDEHPIKKWVYGHFHEHNVEYINNIEFTALINCDMKFDAKQLIYDV